MPGISFLSKKKWHPSTLANQKQVFLAEQEAGLRRKADDIAQHEMNAELAAMEEVKESRNFADADPRDSSLKFMYNQPLVYGKAVEQRVMANGDDEMVATFRSKVFGNAISASTQLEIHGDKDVLLEPEKSVGFKRSLNELTKEELEERHPRLKNAPIEGGYSKKVVVHHKPFSDVIRNVRCLRCRQWGHQSGDRECSMRDNNPLDVVRLKREDPLTQINNELLAIKNSKIVLKPSAAALVASPSVLDSLLPEEGKSFDRLLHFFARFITIHSPT